MRILLADKNKPSGVVINPVAENEQRHMEYFPTDELRDDYVNNFLFDRGDNFDYKSLLMLQPEESNTGAQNNRTAWFNGKTGYIRVAKEDYPNQTFEELLQRDFAIIEQDGTIYYVNLTSSEYINEVFSYKMDVDKLFQKGSELFREGLTGNINLLKGMTDRYKSNDGILSINKNKYYQNNIQDIEVEEDNFVTIDTKKILINETRQDVQGSDFIATEENYTNLMKAKDGRVRLSNGELFDPRQHNLTPPHGVSDIQLAIITNPVVNYYDPLVKKLVVLWKVKGSLIKEAEVHYGVYSLNEQSKETILLTNGLWRTWKADPPGNFYHVNYLNQNNVPTINWDSGNANTIITNEYQIFRTSNTFPTKALRLGIDYSVIDTINLLSDSYTDYEIEGTLNLSYSGIFDSVIFILRNEYFDTNYDTVTNLISNNNQNIPGRWIQVIITDKDNHGGTNMYYKGSRQPYKVLYFPTEEILFKNDSRKVWFDISIKDIPTDIRTLTVSTLQDLPINISTFVMDGFIDLQIVDEFGKKFTDYFGIVQSWNGSDTPANSYALFLREIANTEVEVELPFSIPNNINMNDKRSEITEPKLLHSQFYKMFLGNITEQGQEYLPEQIDFNQPTTIQFRNVPSNNGNNSFLNLRNSQFYTKDFNEDYYFKNEIDLSIQWVNDNYDTNMVNNKNQTRNRRVILGGGVGASLGKLIVGGSLKGITGLALSAGALTGQSANLRDLKNQPGSFDKGEGIDLDNIGFTVPYFRIRSLIPELNYEIYNKIYTEGYSINDLIMGENFASTIINRVWFNYVQTNDIFSNIKMNLSNEYKQFFNSILKSGITLWTYHNKESWKGVANYEYENKEISLLTDSEADELGVTND